MHFCNLWIHFSKHSFSFAAWKLHLLWLPWNSASFYCWTVSGGGTTASFSSGWEEQLCLFSVISNDLNGDCPLVALPSLTRHLNISKMSLDMNGAFLNEEITKWTCSMLNRICDQVSEVSDICVNFQEHPIISKSQLWLDLSRLFWTHLICFTVFPYTCPCVWGHGHNW